MFKFQFKEIEYQNKLFEYENQILQYQNQIREYHNQIQEYQLKEISRLTKSNKTYKSKIEQLKQIGDLDSPKAKKIIESLMQL